MRKVSGVFFQIAAFLVLMACVIGLSSCSNDIDSMIEDYDNHFIRYTRPKANLKPGDYGFDPRSMLEEDWYLVFNNGSMSFSAPECHGVVWGLYKNVHDGYDDWREPVTDELNQGLASGYVTRNERIFAVSEVGKVLENGTYGIELRVQDDKGNEYSDRALIMVVDNFTWKEKPVNIK